jgi:hypothetical protein
MLVFRNLLRFAKRHHNGLRAEELENWPLCISQMNKRVDDLVPAEWSYQENASSTS